jgi:hypothetical protein
VVVVVLMGDKSGEWSSELIVRSLAGLCAPRPSPVSGATFWKQVDFKDMILRKKILENNGFGSFGFGLESVVKVRSVSKVLTLGLPKGSDNLHNGLTPLFLNKSGYSILIMA